jgi:hypothetical protein
MSACNPSYSEGRDIAQIAEHLPRGRRFNPITTSPPPPKKKSENVTSNDLCDVSRGGGMYANHLNTHLEHALLKYLSSHTGPYSEGF